MLEPHRAAQKLRNMCFFNKIRQDFLKEDQVCPTVHMRGQNVRSNEVVSKNAGTNIDRERVLNCIYLYIIRVLQNLKMSIV